MTVDERIHEVIVEMAGEVRPLPDPYGRLRARRRHVQRRRAAVLGSGLAVVSMVAAAAIVLTPGGGGGLTTDTDGNDPLASVNAWAEKLRRTPARGELASAQPAYVEELARLVAADQRAGEFRFKAEVTEVNVLYLDDIGANRVAFVAFHLAEPDPTTKWPNANAWFVAKRGATPAQLADPSALSNNGDGLSPFETTHTLGTAAGPQADVAIALAPGGCVIESAPLPTVDDWTPEPTGSYLVRTHATERREWWRVVCDGVVKEVRPADRLQSSTPIRDADIDAALAGARGQVDRSLAADAVFAGTVGNENYMTGPPRVLWGGQVTGAKPDTAGPYDGTAVLTATPWVPRGWQLYVQIRYAKPTPDGPVSIGAIDWMPDDPTGPAALLPIRLGEGGSVLVIVPEGATTVRAVRGRSIVDTADVSGLGAVVDAPDAKDLVFEAVDAGGGMLASARLPGDPPTDSDVVGW